MPKFKAGDKIALAKVEYRTVLEVVQADDAGYLIKRPYRPFESSILSYSLVDIDNNYELVEAPETSTAVDPDGFDVDDTESPINALAKAEERTKELEKNLKNFVRETIKSAQARDAALAKVEERCRELEEAAKNLYDKVYPLIDGMSKDSWPHGYTSVLNDNLLCIMQAMEDMTMTLEGK